MIHVRPQVHSVRQARPGVSVQETTAAKLMTVNSPVGFSGEGADLRPTLTLWRKPCNSNRQGKRIKSPPNEVGFVALRQNKPAFSGRPAGVRVRGVRCAAERGATRRRRMNNRGRRALQASDEFHPNLDAFALLESCGLGSPFGEENGRNSEAARTRCRWEARSAEPTFLRSDAAWRGDSAATTSGPEPGEGKKSGPEYFRPLFGERGEAG